MLPIQSRKRGIDRSSAHLGTLSPSNNRQIGRSNPPAELYLSSPPLLFDSMDWVSSPVIPGRLDVRLSFPIGPSDEWVLLEAARQKAKEEKGATKAMEKSIPEGSKAEENKAFCREDFSSDEDKLDSEDSKNESNREDNKDWEDNKGSTAAVTAKSLWIESATTPRAKQKLINILKGKTLMPKRGWSFRKILATLLYHRHNRRLCRQFGDLQLFVTRTIMTETCWDSIWPSALQRKDINWMIKFRFQAKIEKRYG